MINVLHYNVQVFKKRSNFNALIENGEARSVFLYNFDEYFTSTLSGYLFELHYFLAAARSKKSVFVYFNGFIISCSINKYYSFIDVVKMKTKANHSIAVAQVN